jgi:AraC-like DNA-binding protein
MWSPAGRFYFWRHRAFYVGPGLPASVHAHHAMQVFVPLSGGIRLRTGLGARWRLFEGAVVPSNQPHESDVPVDLIATLWLEPDWTEARYAVRPRNDVPILPVSRSSLQRIVPRLLACWREGLDARRAGAVMDEVEAVLAREWRPALTGDPRVARARAILDSLPERRVAAPQLAGAVSLSASRLTHLYSAETRMPPRRYLLWLRLLDSVQALARGASLTQAAHAVGFSDAAHLSRTFRRMLGFTPSAALQVSRIVQDRPG